MRLARVRACPRIVGEVGGVLAEEGEDRHADASIAVT